MRKSLLSILIALMASNCVMAQSEVSERESIKQEIKNEVLEELKAEVKTTDDNKLKFKPYGFIRNYFCYDTRECVAVMGETFYMIPQDVRLNEDLSEDLNAVNRVTLAAFTTRFGVDIAGPNIGKATSSAKIEADFSGFGSNNTLFRVRQAFVKLAWEDVALTVGQTWHPMVIQLLPTTIGFSPGAPFAQFNRSPQVNVNVNMGKGWSLLAAAMYQHPNTSVGPMGATHDYARWNLWPELCTSIKHSGENFLFGASVDYLTLKPRQTSVANRSVVAEDGTTSIESVTVRVNDRVSGLSAEMFAEYKSGLFNLKGEVFYGENTAHLTMISGFGATAYDEQTGSYEYAPLRSITSWLNATYGKRVIVGLFGGFSQNLGAKKDFISTNDFWAKGAKNTDYLYRVSPSLTYTIKSLALALEADYTVVGYGDVAINGHSKALRDVGAWRVCAMVKYSF
ncbi:MAG: hypothetical protein IKY82_00185 [Alistipes sp.]|nr:hypothetical protein [Alistipes sp.]